MLSRSDLKGIVRWLGACDPATVEIYGPYPPPRGRKRWRVVLREGDRRKSITTASAEEANKLIEDLKKEISSSIPLSVHQALEQYFEYKAHSIAEISLLTLRDRLTKFLPDIALGALGPAKAERLYEAETGRIGKYGAPVKAATHQALLRNTKEFFRWAVKRKLASSNPFENVEPVGRASVGKRQPRLTEAQQLVRTLLADAKARNEGALALLIQIYAGLRSGEVMGLTVQDVDQEGRAVWVVRGKTRNARRAVKVYEEVAQLLWAHVQGQPREQRVFAANLPRKPKPPWMHKRLARYCKLAGVPVVCPHALRGLNATLAIEGGAPTDAVARALGHASFGVTQRHYADPSALENRKAQQVVDALRGGADPLAGLSEAEIEALKARLRAA
jgi:integrase